MRIFLANLLWFFSTLPDTLRFARALRDPAKAQAAVARRRKPTAEADILLYEPTSGSTGGTKWIPYTDQLRREFMRAVNPWMASLYLRHPRLFFGSHYWSISPRTQLPDEREGPRKGFAEDREYLGAFRCALTRALFPVTAAVADLHDPDEYLRQTARALVASRQLGLISVWHPSSLLRILAFAADHAEELASGKRAEWLKARRFTDLWPRLTVISCWDAAFARADAERLRQLFPNVEIEGKGLMATEGVISFPWFGQPVAAVTSHTLTFETVDPASGEPVPGDRVTPDNLEIGKRYGVVLTTGNGFTDYRLGDVVECVGFVKRTPRLAFRYRGGGTVDLHGEKLHPAFVSGVLETLAAQAGPFRFAVLCPRLDRNGYRLLWEAETGGEPPAAEAVETLLCGNYHYTHARALRQLEPVSVIPVRNGLETWCRALGLAESSAKPPALFRPSSEEGWKRIEQSYHAKRL